MLANAQRLGEALELLRDCVVATDELGRITFANPAVEATFGYTGAEIIGLSFSALQAEPGDICSGETRLRKKSGEVFPAALSAAPLGAPPSAVIFIRDLSGQKRLEADLEGARDAALESSRLKSSFLANMSHEIRTPMNGILGMVELLLNTDLKPEQREYAETIRGSAHFLLNILNDILDLSRIEAGKMPVERVEFDPVAAVEEATELFSARAAEKSLTLTCRVDNGISPALLGDPLRVRQIMNNLIGNAIKFTARGTVEVRLIRERESPEEITLRFEVSDSGVGVRADQRETIFEAFTQSDDSMARRYGGTGLGLSVCRELVSLMGGEIGVESEEGRGSRFWLRVTFAKAAQYNPEAELEKFAGVEMLVITTSQPIAENLAFYAESIGIKTHWAGTSGAALSTLTQAAARKKTIDLVAMDSDMPDIRVPAVLDSIRGLTRLPYIIPLIPFGQEFSARPGDPVRVSYRISKPLRRNQAIGRLRRLLSIGENATPLETGWDAGRAAARTPAPVKVPAAKPAPADSGPAPRILLVEDQPVNQVVARRLLEALGQTCEIASGGKEALREISREDFDLIFMDCQMPGMDGYETTRHIRKFEEGRRHTPIIAMTAHAMEGDREKCLEAGMDDYLVKPVSLSSIEGALVRWSPSAAGQSRGAAQRRDDGAKAADDAPLDQTAIETLRGIPSPGHGNLFLELIEIFLPDFQSRFAELGAALEAGDLEEVVRAGHTLKGSSGNIGARRLASMMAEMENYAKAGAADQARGAFDQAGREFERVRAALTRERRRPV